MNCQNIAKGPGVFKLNSSLFLDEEYQELITNGINETANINKNCNPKTLN